MVKINLKKIPIFNTPDKPLSSATQDFIPVADIADDVLIYKNGGAALIMESTSLNFGLLSEKEQRAVVAAYAALINSLSFSVQILVHSQRKDIGNYLHYLDEAQQKIANPKLQGLMQGYKTFIRETVKKKNILGKRFFVVIPFSPLELGVKKSFASVTKQSGPLPFPKSYVIKKAKVALYPRRDHLIRQAGRLGIKIEPLDTVQLVNLLYESFNPQPPARRQQQVVNQPKQ